MGRSRCSASAGCATCARPNRASRARTRARWSTNGSRCRASVDKIAWRPEVVARRIMSWLSQAPLVLHEADPRFYRRFLRSLTRQVRYLRRTAGNTRDGLPRFQCVIALTAAALCMAGQERLLQVDHAPPGRRAAAAGAARRRSHQPQSGRADRAPARSPAGAPGVRRPQRGAAAGPDQRHRPHDADAALLPPWRRQFRPVQRHGTDARRPSRHRAGL